jgi:hypothetical protein
LRGADGTSKGRNKGVVDLTTVEDFGVEYQGITQIMGNLKIAQARHNFNIIFCAHVIKTDYYKVGGLISHSTETIVTQGKKIAAKIPAMFDEVYSFYVDSTTGDQMCRTASDGIVPARSSFKGMPKEFKWTNSPSLYNGLCKFYDVASLKTGETK